ncbi:MAG: hypothetical protein ACHQD7_01855 [Chitinophagales bacterium]
MRKLLSSLMLCFFLIAFTGVTAQTTPPTSTSKADKAKAKADKDAAKAKAKADKAAAKAATTAAPVANPPAVKPAAAPVVKSKPVVNPVNKSADKAIGTDAKGRTIYEGSKGGRYTLSPAGNKEYIKK